MPCHCFDFLGTITVFRIWSGRATLLKCKRTLAFCAVVVIAVVAEYVVFAASCDSGCKGITTNSQ